MSTTIVQVEMTDLEVTINVGVRDDPGGTFEEGDAAPRVPVAPTTAGPHRFTVHVPHDDQATFSIGQGCPDRIKDTGITGRTNTHIHFETRETAKTIVSLGGPTEDAMIFSYDEPVLGSSNGFAMVTEELAWMEADKKFHVTSRTEDVVVRAMQPNKRIVLQADHGHVDVVAKETANTVAKTVNISAPVAPAPADVNYAGAWDSQVPDHHSTENWLHSLEIAAIASVAVDLAVEGITLIGGLKKWKAESASPYMKPSLGVLHMAATAARVIATGLHVHANMSHPHLEGCVKIGSEKDFGAVAGATANVFGKTGATLASAMFSTVVAPLATLEGVLFAGVAGKQSTVLGLLGVEVAAPLGAALIEGKTEVALDSHGKIRIGGHDDVFMRSGHHGAFVHGHSKGFVGAGVGSGWGLIAETDKLRLGKLTSADNLPSADVDADHAITVSDESITVYHQKAGLAVRNNQVTLQSKGKAGELVIDGTEIKVDGARIMLG